MGCPGATEAKASPGHRGLSAACGELRDISFPQLPPEEARMGQCPWRESRVGAAGGAWGQAGDAGSFQLQQPQLHLQPQGPAPWRQLPLGPGAPGPGHAHQLQLVGSRPWPPTPQLQGAEAPEVMHAEEAWPVATGNDIADPSPQALQGWPQLQDVLSPAQA